MNEISKWLKKYSNTSGVGRFVVGISGGIDSALVSTLCAESGYPTILVSMPIHQHQNELNRANNHIKWLETKYSNVSKITVDLTNLYDTFESLFDNTHGLALANSRARLRMTTLYQIAQSNGALVVGTGNKVEDFGVGFFTKYGDGGVDISPIADLMKSEVRKMAKELGVNEEILNASPTDGLWGDSRTDEDQIGATYDELEWAMKVTAKEFKEYSIKHHGINSLYYDKLVSSMTPYIIEERQLNVAQMDVFSRLMMDRIIFLGTGINDSIANIIQAQLLFLESTDKDKDIQIYINSPGGSVYAGLGIYDTMQFINPEVATICTGIAASMAAVLLCAGQKGKRSGLTHSRVMIHQPLGGAQGQASDIEITAREIGKLKKELYEIIANHSGQKYDKVYHDSDRDYWMKSEEAKKYGMIDEVLSKK